MKRIRISLKELENEMNIVHKDAMRKILGGTGTEDPSPFLSFYNQIKSGDFTNVPPGTYDMASGTFTPWTPDMNTNWHIRLEEASVLAYNYNHSGNTTNPGDTGSSGSTTQGSITTNSNPYEEDSNQYLATGGGYSAVLGAGDKVFMVLPESTFQNFVKANDYRYALTDSASHNNMYFQEIFESEAEQFLENYHFEITEVDNGLRNQLGAAIMNLHEVTTSSDTYGYLSGLISSLGIADNHLQVNRIILGIEEFTGSIKNAGSIVGGVGAIFDFIDFAHTGDWVDAAQVVVWAAALGNPEPVTKATLAVLGVGLEIYELYRDRVLNAGTTVGNQNMVIN